MNLLRITLAVVLTGAAGAAAMAQTPPDPLPEKKTDSPALMPEQYVDAKTAPPEKDSARAEAYYNFTIGHIYEQQYEATSNAEYATKAIEAYKKAYVLDPKSQVIGERLAEMYWKAQRIHDAVAEAQEILKRDPDNVQSRRLLGRIYLRSLGDISAGSAQSETVGRAIEQYLEINRLDPSAAEAVMLLEGITAHSPSPVLLDLLGDAHTQAHELEKAEGAYRKAAELDPAELSHQRGLGQTLLAEEKYSEALKVYEKLSDLMPDDSDVYLRIAQIYRELHQLDKAEQNLVKARQYAPGSLEVMYNEAMLYQ